MDVLDLRDFYDEGLGRLARTLLRRRIRHIWPDLKGERVLGLGYATPYLSPGEDGGERTIALMPAGQGVLHWPSEGRGLAVLAGEDELPFPDLFFDRVLVVHALEFSRDVRPALREIWRVMSERGRLLVVAPNRRGIWARFDHTPFGQGHPYTARQLSALLRDTMFAPLRAWGALYVPPVRSRLVAGAGVAWERMCEPWFDAVAGAVVVEAAKRIYAAEPAAGARRRRRVFAAEPGGAVRRGGTNLAAPLRRG